eukprot:COSAG02_NODE_503_length_20999_cov_7.403110_15_plen_196_part_00
MDDVDLQLPNDFDIQRFIVEGYAICEPSFGADFHAGVAQLIDQIQPPVLTDVSQAPDGVEWAAEKARWAAGEQSMAGVAPGSVGKIPGTEKYFVLADSPADNAPLKAVLDIVEGGLVDELQARVDQVYAAPDVAGLLTGLLGENYVMDAASSSMIVSRAGKKGQQWHKGGSGKRRHHYPRHISVLYCACVTTTWS